MVFCEFLYCCVKLWNLWLTLSAENWLGLRRFFDGTFLESVMLMRHEKAQAIWPCRCVWWLCCLQTAFRHQSLFLHGNGLYRERTNQSARICLRMLLPFISNKDNNNNNNININNCYILSTEMTLYIRVHITLKHSQFVFLSPNQLQGKYLFDRVNKLVTQRKSKRFIELSRNLIGFLPKMSVYDWLFYQETLPQELWIERWGAAKVEVIWKGQSTGVWK